MVYKNQRKRSVSLINWIRAWGIRLTTAQRGGLVAEEEEQQSNERSPTAALDLSRNQQARHNNPGLDALFNRTWFTRGWTFQEVMLASNVIFVSGPSIISLDRVIRGLHILSWNRTEQWKPATPISQDALDVLSSWMFLDRPLDWNGQRIRQDLPSRQLAGSPNYSGAGPSYVDYWEESRLRMLRRPWVPLLAFMTIWTIEIITSLTPYLFALFAIRVLITGTRNIFDTIFLYVGLFFGGLWLFYEFYSTGHLWIGVFPLQKHLEPARPLSAINGVIHAMRGRNCGNNLDKSYAVQGILQRVGCRPEYSVPDYAKNKGRVYLELMADLITWRPDMIQLLLDSGECLRHLGDAPS